MQRFRNILIVISGEAMIPASVERAKQLAKANQARVTLMSVSPVAEAGRLGARGADLETQLDSFHREVLDEMAQGFAAEGIVADVVMARGVVFLEAIRQVLRAGHDLVMKAVDEQGQSARYFASDDMHLMRKCPCPVWMLKSDEPRRSRKIMAAIDPESAASGTMDTMVMQLATSLAVVDEAELHVVHAWRLHEESLLRSRRFGMSPSEIENILSAEQAAAQARLDAFLAGFPDMGARRIVSLEKGFAGDVIPHYAAQEGIDTVVMGTLGRTGIAGLFIGNTAEAILASVHCAVIAVKPAGFVSPVTAAD